MASPVEAGSLSSLTTAAFNPPQYPRNPTHPERQSLVLYIARVPGSKDVFLTTIKPREKVVTAQDIQSSLYYLHVNRPEDELLSESDSNGQGASAQNLRLDHRSSIRRKPLASESPIASHQLGPVNAIVPPALHNIDQSLDTMGERLHRPALSERKWNSHENGPNPSSIARKPLLPQRGAAKKENINPNKDRNPEARNIHDTYHLHDTFIRSDSGEYPVSSYMQEATSLPRALLNSAGSGSSISRQFGTSPGTTSSSTGNLEKSKATRDAHDAVSLGTCTTLIRRDPASGAQWNVGKITDPPVLEVSSETIGKSLNARRHKQAGAPIYIEINNPGYIKFATEDEQMSRPSSAPKGHLRVQVDGRDHEHAPPPEEHTSTRGTFRRRLWMENSRPDPQMGHRKTSSSNSNSSNVENRLSMDFWRSDYGHIHSGSNDSVTYLPKQYTPLNPPPTSAPKRSSNSKGYVFISPWNGRCEFSTGSAGRSLFCDHFLPSTSSTASSSLPVPISELRFNLPTSGPLSAPATPGLDGAPSPKSSLFGRSRRRKSLSSSFALDNGASIDDDAAEDLERLDLSLGREHAGGGYGGKQAKLGKLIIEDEGQMMLDLVVAANLGLWWRAYEKAESRRPHTW